MSAEPFIMLLIVAVTQIVKMFFPQINGKLTVALAIVVGVLVALVDVPIGVEDISIATGIQLSLGAVGISALASKAGGGAKGDEPKQ